MAEHTPTQRLRNGEYYNEGAKVFRAPVWSKNDEGGSTISIGFHACAVTKWCEPVSVVSCLNASRHLETLVKALEFYADPTRYDGPNQRLIGSDPFTPQDQGYRQDVIRDGGNIAREAIAKASA